MATPSEITSEPLHLMSFDTQNTWQCCLLEEKLIRSDLFCHENLCAIVPMDFLAFELYDFFYILNSMTKKCLGTEAQRISAQKIEPQINGWCYDHITITSNSINRKYIIKSKQ